VSSVERITSEVLLAPYLRSVQVHALMQGGSGVEIVKCRSSGPPARGCLDLRIGWTLGIVAALLAIIGTFLPWITAGTVAIPGYPQVGGIAIIIFVILGVVFVFIRQAGARLAIIFGLLVAIMAALTFLSPSLVASFPGTAVRIEYGVWLSLVGGILMMIAGWIAGMEARRAAVAKAAAK